MITNFLVRPVRHPEFTLTGEVPAKGDYLRVYVPRKAEELGKFTVEVYQVTNVHRNYKSDPMPTNWSGPCRLPSEQLIVVQVNHIRSELE